MGVSYYYEEYYWALSTNFYKTTDIYIRKNRLVQRNPIFDLGFNKKNGHYYAYQNSRDQIDSFNSKNRFLAFYFRVDDRYEETDVRYFYAFQQKLQWHWRHTIKAWRAQGIVVLHWPCALQTIL